MPASMYSHIVHVKQNRLRKTTGLLHEWLCVMMTLRQFLGPQKDKFVDTPWIDRNLILR